ncbi:MAG TPA: hypothetical protein DD633_03885 [Sphaerochaeta sp.]|nr:hypothetical protein [Sphaerochaeta sp.]
MDGIFLGTAMLEEDACNNKKGYNLSCNQLHGVLNFTYRNSILNYDKLANKTSPASGICRAE